MQDAFVVFDIDGTLFETHRVTVPAVQQTFEAFGLPKPSDEKVCSFFGRPVDEYEAWLAAQSSPEQAAEIVEATNQRELELIGEAGVLYPGARETLENFAQRGYAMAICSNGPDAYVAEFLRAHALEPFFCEVRARDTKYDGKETMLRELMTVVSTRPVIVIGDREDDVTSAHANGAWAISAGYGFGSPAEWSAADALVHAASEIPQAVDTLLLRSA